MKKVMHCSNRFDNKINQWFLHDRSKLCHTRSFQFVRSAWLVCLMLAAVLLGLSGCDNNTENSSEQTAPAAAVDNAKSPANARESILRRGNGAEPQTLDPHRAEGVTASNILRDIYEGLITAKPNGELTGGVAKDWSISDDGKVYTFNLRADAKWSDGSSVTASDFVSGLQRSINPATGSSYSKILEPIVNATAILEGKKALDELGVKALNPKQLEIQLNAATPYFLGLLTHSTTYPIHAESVAEHGRDFIRPGKHITNGAYQLTEWRTNDYIMIERNPHYWDNANTSIEKVIFYAIDNADTEFKRYQAGGLDITGTIPPPQIDNIRRKMPDQLRIAPYLGVYYYGFNTQRPPLNDPRLRQALSMVVDRTIITDKVLKMGQIPALGWVPPNIANYSPQKVYWAGWSMQKRLSEARKLYQQAGYSLANPAEIEILYNTSESHKTIAILVSDMWRKQLGVKTKLKNQEWKSYLATRKDPEQLQAFRAGWIGDYNDANTFLEILQSQHGMNNEGYANSKFDELLLQAANEGEMTQRANLLQQAEQLILQEMPTMPIYFYVSSALVKPYVQGYVDNIQDHHYSKHLSFK